MAAAAVETATGDSSREKQLSRTSSSDSDEIYSGSSPKGGKAIPASGEAEILIMPHVMDKTLILDHNNNNNPPPPLTVSLPDGGGGGDGDKTAQEQQELYLKTLYTLSNSQNFYCPNCKSCITRVIILRDAPSSNGGAHSPPPSQSLSHGPRELPLSSPRPAIVESPPQVPAAVPGEEDETGSIFCGNCFSFLTPIGAWISSQFGFGQKKPAMTAIRTDASTLATKKDPSTSRVDSSSIFHESRVEGDDSIVIPVTHDSNETTNQEAKGGRKLEIIKSIVYGGLVESITSLGIVTSAATAGTPTENIVALAVANLITGLIVILNNLHGLKSNQLKKEEEAQVDPYEEALGDRHHYLLHFTTAIISFLVFGLVPPLVYGFSFRDTDNGDLKLAVVAGASLLCITLLAIGKAYIQKPHKWEEFVKTVVYYIALGYGAAGLSYLAGKEFDKLLDQLGWFKRAPTPPTFLLPNMDFSKPSWGSL
ncbi:uncharacterized protein LOC111024659 [Momordica charantia]|uniref:Uncharacterized protein LOC111024659 n=1 Tax=Momordica charantia TaxID=3673 RepID=A0A6J1DUU0_MOMCH|nr:uncharacterized protein LOC111024659 [Momordica charantia]